MKDLLKYFGKYAGIILIVNMVIGLFILTASYIWSKLTGSLSIDDYTCIVIIAIMVFIVINYNLSDLVEEILDWYFFLNLQIRNYN